MREQEDFYFKDLPSLLPPRLLVVCAHGLTSVNFSPLFAIYFSHKELKVSSYNSISLLVSTQETIGVKKGHGAELYVAEAGIF